MNEKIIIFKCPYFNKCYESKTYFHADDDPIEVFENKKCKAPFLATKHNEIMCGLVIDDIEKYPKAIKSIKLYKKPLKQKIKDFFKV